MLRRLTLTAVAAAALASPAAASAALVHFTTPSGNIDCRADTAREVWCSVEKGQWGSRAGRPAGCPTDYFPRDVRLSSSGRVSVGSCRGDIGPWCDPSGGADGCRVLPYGRSVRIGRIRCTSSKAGVTCRTRLGRGPGFRVSRERLVRFR